MGFCRRCGDIVVGPRCKCGGTPVAPVVQWNQSNPKEKIQDRWSKTYVAREKSPTRTLTLGPSVSAITAQLTGASSTTESRSASPTKRFPRPASAQVVAHPIPMGTRVSAHIASTTAQMSRPPSPLKQFTVPAPESDIIPCPKTSSLLKVYGSVLQPKESLATHSCVICFSTFPPDATIYPDPNTPSSSTRFLCRPCFITNGGSKGNCPTCARPVLTLKSEGAFVSAAGKFWHKRCFRCEGCFKDIGDTPMVDLLGKPSCAECFDGCLKRDPTTPKKWESPRAAPSPNGNLGGMKGEKKSREGSPAIEELEQRLGIVKSRENSPALEELSQRLSIAAKKSEESPTQSSLASRYSSTGKDRMASIPSNIPLLSRYSLPATREGSPFTSSGRDGESPSSEKKHERFKRPEAEEGRPSPIRFGSSSPKPTEDAVEEMKRRFLRGSSSSPAPSPCSSDVKSGNGSPSTTPLRSRLSTPYSSPFTKSPIPSKIPVSVSTSNGRFSIGTSLRKEHDARGEGAREREQYNEREGGSQTGREESLPSTPDMMSDCSDTTTQSSELNSPPRDDDVFDGGTIRGRGRATAREYECGYMRGDFLDEGDGGDSMITPTHTPKSKTATTFTNTKSPSSTKYSNIRSLPPFPMLHSSDITTPSSLPPDTTCEKCGGGLFTLREGAEARFVTVPEEPRDSGKRPKTYHTECFKCAVCEGVFKEGGQGQAVFVRAEGGPCHVECAPTENINVRSTSRANSVASIFSSTPTPAPTTYTPICTSPISSRSMYSSSRYDGSPPSSSTSTSFPRFGTTTACPGCHKSVSPMERGVVPGPQGTRWHATCLVCGGKQEVKKGIWGGVRRKGEPGCQKKLDSAAKGDGEGGVWCRECFLLLPVGMRGSPQASPTRSPTRPLTSSHTGGGGLARVAPQYTGTTTIARQFTGIGKTDAALMRQLTGGGLSPTRQLTSSPTKQLGLIGGRPRPKSVIGMRSGGGRSIDEGRGMFLVRQMTGSGGE